VFEINQFLKDCVITIVSDDYENFEVILGQTRHLASLKGVTVHEDEVAQAVEKVIAEGLVEAYFLSPHEPHSVKTQYSLEQVHELWFYVTPQGKAAAKGIPKLSGEEN
jgi:hypothetical protein